MRQIRHHSSPRRHGFTLIEIMIALSLFLVLLAVIFIPLNQAFQVFNAGRTSIALQSAADNSVKTIAAELQGAIAVYPNDNLPGITDRAPYAVGGVSAPPYYENAAATCDSTKRKANPARIDFLLPIRNGADGTVASPVKPETYVVTYFVQRQKAQTEPTAGFDAFSNPLGVYRAQTLYKTSGGATVANMNNATTRYNTTGCNSDWLRQTPADTTAGTSKTSEPQLPTDTSATSSDERTLVTPRDTGVNVDPATMQPDLNFTCEDVDSNGVIDRVTITLTLVQYESGDGGRQKDGQLLGQRVTASQVVNLPNTRLGV